MQRWDNPYHGAPVERVTATNGAIASRALVEHRRLLEPQVLRICDGVWSVIGLSVANAHAVAGERGLTVVDSGSSATEGAAIRRLLRQVSDRPIVAVVYTHSHYIKGTGALLADEPDADGIPIYAHHRLPANLGAERSLIEPGYWRRLGAQYGIDLPVDGPDADPCRTGKRLTGPDSSRPPTELIAADDEVHIIDGVQWRFWVSYPWDSNDSLIAFLPERRVAIHNHLSRSSPNQYSIAGGPYRDPRPWLAGLDRMIACRPDHLLGVHTPPLIGRAETERVLQGHRDALQLLYDQAVRGINQGLDADAILARFQLPTALANDPDLQPHYSDWGGALRSIVTGLIGWYSGDATNLIAGPARQRAGKRVALMGGSDAVCDAAEEALTSKDYAWAAELARDAHLAGAERAAGIWAAALRQAAQVSPTWTTRNACLQQALELEGTADRWCHPPRLTVEGALRTPPGTILRQWATRIDPQRLGERQASLRLHFSDCDFRRILQLRHGVCAIVADEGADVDATLTSQRQQFLRYALDACTAEELLTAEGVTINGDRDRLSQLFDCFDPWYGPAPAAERPW